MIEINKNLYCYSENFNYLKKIFFSNNLPSSVIVNGLDGIGKKTFLTHFLINTQYDNFINENKVLNDKDIIKFNKNMFPNIKLIQNKDNSINISEIRDLINYTNQSSLNDKPRFVLISNIENLNINATNAFLKLLEKPPKNVFLFLLKNSESRLSDTINSRCFKINIHFSQETKKKILTKLLEDFNLIGYKNYEIFDQNETPGLIVNKILYLTSNSIENLKLLEIILFCLNDYKIKKNITSLLYADSFAKFFFYKKLIKKFYKFNEFQITFQKILNDVVFYNADIQFLINILKNIPK